jgi:hypothetical protein
LGAKRPQTSTKMGKEKRFFETEQELETQRNQPGPCSYKPPLIPNRRDCLVQKLQHSPCYLIKSPQVKDEHLYELVGYSKILQKQFMKKDVREDFVQTVSDYHQQKQPY